MMRQKGSSVKKLEVRRGKGRTQLIVALGVALVLAGCHKGRQAFQSEAHQEPAQNLDSSLAGYEQALKKTPKMCD